jgi:PhnB protein
MASRLNPYLNFNGNARAAMAFYHSVFGGEFTSMTYAEGGMQHDPADADKIMHSQLISPSGYWLMLSDTPPHFGHNPGNTMSVSLSGDAEAELTGYWNKLTDGANVSMPLSKAPWGDSFGMLVDKFGVSWLVNIAGPGRS